jgi:WD40 repeat protein
MRCPGCFPQFSALTQIYLLHFKRGGKMRKNLFSMRLGLISILSLMLFSIVLPLYAQDAPPGLIEAAITAANESNPELGRPSNWTWEQLPPTNFSTLACPIAVGYDTGTAVTPYRVRLTFAAGEYVVHVSADTAQVQLCDVKFADMGSGTSGTGDPTPDPAVPTATVVPGSCMLAPAAAYSNVRSHPALEGALLGVIYENSSYPVLGRNDVGTWFLIEAGWVASSVAELSGDCTNVPHSTVVVYGERVSADVASNPYPCAVDFAGYMQPRVELGEFNITVTDDGVPNRLRLAPTTTAQIVGEVPSGGVIDWIIDGPACNEGYVWWLVNYGELDGWTVESNNASGEYYLEPSSPVPSVDVPDGATFLSDHADFGFVEFSPSANTLAATDVDTGSMTVNLYNLGAMSTEPFAQLTHDSPVANVIFGQTWEDLITSDFGGVTFWHRSPATRLYEPSQVLSGMSTHNTGFAMTANPDWTLLVVSSCLQYTDMGCLTGELRVWNMQTNTWVRTLSEPEFNPYIIEFRSDGTTLMAADHEAVKFWDVTSGALLNTIPTNINSISDATFSPDGMMVAIGGCAQTTAGSCLFGTIEIWNVVTMSLIRAMQVEGGQVMAVDFTPDGLYVAGAAGATVQFWGAATGLNAATLTGFDAIVTNFMISELYTADAYQVATVDMNNMLLIWQVALPTAATTSNG